MTNSDRRTLEARASGDEFTCDLPALPLVPGRYRIDVEVHGRAYLQDAIEGAAFFDVEQGVLGGRPVDGTRAATSWSTTAGRRRRSTSPCPLFARAASSAADSAVRRSREPAALGAKPLRPLSLDEGDERSGTRLGSSARFGHREQLGSGLAPAGSTQGLGQPDCEPDEFGGQVVRRCTCCL